MYRKPCPSERSGCHSMRLRTWFSLLILSAAALISDLSQAQDSRGRTEAVPVAADRNDSFDVKLKLLQEAWNRGHLDLARSLTHSLRHTILQRQHEGTKPKGHLIDTEPHSVSDVLPAAWQDWAAGWNLCTVVSVQEPIGERRIHEPVEITLKFPAAQVGAAFREVRVARLTARGPVEVPSQVFGELRRGPWRYARVLWMADCEPHENRMYLIFSGNSDAELPEYPSDLKTEGEGVGLNVTNAHFQAVLSPRTGQMERLILRREHGLELFSGGQGHGEPPGIDWAHDYVDEYGFEKLRVSLWDRCPDYEIVRGPLCTVVRRWGFPYSPVHPVDSPARLHVDVEYRFYSGLPWFLKIGRMTAVQDLNVSALRDDEWVFSGHSFTDTLWMSRDGRLHIGDVDPEHRRDLWGVGFFHRDSRDSFMAMFLEHRADGIPELVHGGVPTLSYRWHGNLWSRYPLPQESLPAGTVLHQKNAYAAIPFTPSDGPVELESLRRRLMNPLIVSPGPEHPVFESSVGEGDGSETVRMHRLGRPGETGDQAEIKRRIREALRDCRDAQLYRADVSVFDLGLVYDIRFRGDVVTLVMTMPHRGRPLTGYFVDGSVSVHPTPSVPLRTRLLQIPGVRQVDVRTTWNPPWNSGRLTDEGRRRLGLD